MTNWTPERIRALKASHGLSYSALSREIGIKPRTIRSWVYPSGERQPGKSAIAALDRLASTPPKKAIP
jgi:transposase-like protein